MEDYMLGFPTKGFLKYLLRLFLSVLISIGPLIALMLILKERLYTTSWKGWFYVLAVALAIYACTFFTIDTQYIEYGHYKKKEGAFLNLWCFNCNICCGRGYLWLFVLKIRNNVHLR